MFHMFSFFCFLFFVYLIVQPANEYPVLLEHILQESTTVASLKSEKHVSSCNLNQQTLIALRLLLEPQLLASCWQIIHLNYLSHVNISYPLPKVHTFESMIFIFAFGGIQVCDRCLEGTLHKKAQNEKHGNKFAKTFLHLHFNQSIIPLSSAPVGAVPGLYPGIMPL